MGPYIKGRVGLGYFWAKHKNRFGYLHVDLSREGRKSIVGICVQNMSDAKSETQPAHTATLGMMSYMGRDKRVKEGNCLEEHTHPLLLGCHCDMLITSTKQVK